MKTAVAGCRLQARTNRSPFRVAYPPHDLHSEFPDAADALHALKVRNEHFGKLAAQYHDLNREIHRIDSGIEAASDDRTEQLKKERLAILDQVAMMIRELSA